MRAPGSAAVVGSPAVLGPSVSLLGQVDPSGVSPADGVINAALAQYAGYDVLLPPNPNGGQASFKCNNPIVIGNGSSTAASTQNGTRLILPGKTGLGVNNTPQGRLFAGVALAQLVVVQGPCFGNGLINAYLDPNGLMAGGTMLTVTSGQAGDFDGLVVKVPGGGTGILENIVGGAVANQNTMHNRWRKIAVVFANTNTCTAWVMTTTGVTFNVSYEELYDIFIGWAAAGAAQTMTAFKFVGCDNIRAHGVHCNSYIAGAGTNQGALFDYSVSASKPADIAIDDVDWGSASTTFANNGAPNANATPNRVLAISATNGQPADPGIANLYWGAVGPHGVSAAMVAGAVTVNTPLVKAGSKIIVARQSGGANAGAVFVSAVVAGTSFTVTSTNAADTGTVAWAILDP